jgi:hypothetical protein
MQIDLGSFILNSDWLIKQLKNDLKDDWFPDPLGYADMFEDEFIAQQIADNYSFNHGQYVPSERAIFNIPKSNFTLRYALETSIADRAIYHGLTSHLVPFFDPLIPWNVFSHRHDPIRPRSRYMFKNPVQSWKDFIHAVRTEGHPAKYILSTDISNYYENIDLRLLKTAMLSMLEEIQATPQEKGQIRARLIVLFDCLTRWAYEANRGLPQNRDASSFLANLYMSSVDTAMRSNGYADSYFRYMDDVKIVCEDQFQARRALKTLSVALRDIGLSLNAKKTDIISAANTEAFDTCLSDASVEVQAIDVLWRKQSRDAILATVPRLKRLTLGLLQAAKTDSRDFRYCVARLAQLATSKGDFAIPPDFFHEITPSIIEVLADAPASTDQFTRYLQAVPTLPVHITQIKTLLGDQNRCIYTWQNYRLWLLLTQKQFADRELKSLAQSIVRQGPDNATRAGATIYLGHYGDREERNDIARHFGALSSFIGQRNALISIQELPFKPLIHAHVAPHVRPDLKGVYRRLNSLRIGYAAMPEPVSILRLAAEDNSHDQS